MFSLVYSFVIFVGTICFNMMATNQITKYTYSKADFIYNTHWKNKEGTSNFDKAVQSSWKSKADAGYFRYKLNIKDWRILPGKFNFFVQVKYLLLQGAKEKNRPIIPVNI